ncbi:MAG: galactose-1-phosphate uridylyltransferase, partial [Actinomycetota bacterium]
MSQMRLNPLNGRWVTIVPGRAHRPSDFAQRDRSEELQLDRPCPFCVGNEEETPPALETYEPDGSWSMRVIPNKYPAFDGTDPFAVQNLGPVHVQADASGIHEVFVYSTDHEGGLQDLDDEHAAEFMHVLKRRLAEHADHPFVRYTQVIVNHGREAGASIAHPHGQILGLPFVPTEVLDEERAFARFAGNSLLDTMIEAELVAEERIVMANDDAVVMCPFASGVPYEMLVLPREQQAHLQDASDTSLAAVGVALR